MRRLLVLSVVAVFVASSVGCSSCGNSCGNGRSSLFSWFNRGDSCRTCGSGDIVSEEGYTGSLGTPILQSVPNAPRTMGELPGPVGITPVPAQ
jgi:hypothetical protein